MSLPVSGALTKQEKGRLKKLRKRANVIDNTRNFSGIGDISEWRELQLLERRSLEETSESSWPNPGASIHWKPASRRRKITVEYASHRDLLAFLTRQVCENLPATISSTPQHHESTTRKRRILSDVVTAQPQKSFEWAIVHNPALIQELCVLEIHWQGDEPLQLVADRIQKACKQMHVIKVPTLWFQSNARHPQDITEALMYRPQKPVEQQDRNVKKPKTSQENKLFQVSDLVRRLNPLCLTTHQMEKEKFPQDSNGCQAIARVQRIGEMDVLPSSISQTDAELILSTKWVRVTSTAVNASANYVCNSHISEARNYGPKIYALDCEMVETTAGIELGRATLCHLESYDTATGEMSTEIVFDVFVRPQNSVVDYKTKWSGLTAKVLDDSTKTVSLEQVQACVMQRVHPQDILVGHSLENDLHSMRWVHPTVVDTAILFRRKGRNTSKCSLEFLTRQLLNRHIQKPDKPHCSEEDALAALELAVRRAVVGDHFDITSSPSMENWFAGYSTTYPTNNFVGIAGNKWLQKHVVQASTLAHAVVTNSTITKKTAKTILSSCSKKSHGRVLWANVVAETADSIETLLVELQGLGVIAVALQAGLSTAKRRTENKRLRQSPKATLPWTDEEETAFKESMITARNGYVLYLSSQSAQQRSSDLPSTISGTP